MLEALQNALLSVFPSYTDLERFLLHKMSVRLADFAAEDGMKDVCLKLLQRFKADGAQIKELARLIWSHYPSNPEVRAFVFPYWDTFMEVAPDDRALQEMTVSLRLLLQKYRVSTGAEREELEARIHLLRDSRRRGDELRSGEILGEPPRYQLLERTQSPWTEVWKAVDIYSNEPDAFVAVKILLPEQAKDPGKLKWFQDSAEEARKIRHENMIEILVSAGCYCNQFHFMVMSWARGGSLRNAVLKKSHVPSENKLFLPAREALESVLQAGEAIAALHRKKIFHGAITPRNILLDVSSDGALVALLAEPSPSGFFVAGDFAAPELRNAAPLSAAATAASDQFSLALVALFVLRPDNTVEPTRLEGLESEKLRSVLSRALSEDPGERYVSVAQFCKELKDARDQSKASELERPEDAARLLEILLLVPPDKREHVRARLIEQMKLSPEVIRPVVGDVRVRAPELQWRHIIFDFLVSCRGGRLGELAILVGKEAMLEGSSNATPRKSSRFLESFTPSRLLALVCQEPEGTIEAIALHLGLWSAVSPDQTTLGARARSLLHDALEKYGSLEETARALHEVGELQDTRFRAERAPWLHEELVFAVERAIRLFAPRDLGASSLSLPDGLVRIVELTNLKEYWWLQSEIGAVWRELVHARRLPRSGAEGVYESFDDMDRALRRLIVQCPRLTRGAPEGWRWFRLYQTICKLPPHLFRSVVEGCDAPVWALPGPEEAPAWRALHLVHWCQSWSLPENLSSVLSQRFPQENASDDPSPQGRSHAVKSSPGKTLQEALLDLPAIHFSELLLFLGEPLDSSLGLLARVEQLVERHGPADVPSCRLARAYTFVSEGLPTWPTSTSPRIESETQLRDELPGRLRKLSSEQLEAVAKEVGMGEEFLPSRAASHARRVMELLAYCQPFSDALTVLANQIDQVVPASGTT